MSNIDSNVECWEEFKKILFSGSDALAARVAEYGEQLGKLEEEIRSKPLTSVRVRELSRELQDPIKKLAASLGTQLASIDARGIATSKVDIIVFNKLKSVASQLDDFSRLLDYAIAYDDVPAMAKSLKRAGKVFGAVTTVLFTVIDVAGAIGRGDWWGAAEKLITGAVGFAGAAAGAKVGAKLGAKLGALAGPKIAIAGAFIGAGLGSYYAIKTYEVVVGESPVKRSLEYYEELYADFAAVDGLKEALMATQKKRLDALGKLDGTWLNDSGFSKAEKIEFMQLYAYAQGVKHSDALVEDITTIFDMGVQNDANLLIKRDVLLKSLLQFAVVEGGYTERKITEIDGNIFFDIKNTTSALGNIQNTVANTLSDADKKLFGRIEVERAAIVAGVGRIDSSNKSTLFVGGGKADTFNGSQKSDEIVGGDGADELNGLGGDDSIFGGAGADIIKGGAGNDLLAGGEGNDTYDFKDNFGFDTIYDSDKSGTVKLDGKVLKGANKKIAENRWLNEEQNIVYTKIKTASSTDIVITRNGSNSSDAIVLKDWQDGNLGIRLSGEQESEDLRIFVGDRHGSVKNKDGKEVYEWTVTNGEVNAATGVGGGAVVEAPGFEDVIYGSNKADKIEGLAGNDLLDGKEGNDDLYGGEGDDLIFGGGGSDYIKGGDGNDFILSSGSSGASTRKTNKDKEDFLKKIKEKGGIPQGEVVFREGPGWILYGKKSTGEKFSNGAPNSFDEVTFYPSEDSKPKEWLDADYVDAGDGDDVVATSDGNDTILAGSGNDLVIGNGGSDLILGLDGNDVIHADGITFRSDQGTRGYGTTPSGLHGNDIVYAGSGNDLLVGGLGSDELHGDADNDVLFGDDGANTAQYFSLHGNDNLYGGTGNDYLTGQGGSDIINGGKGKDRLWGDDSVKNIGTNNIKNYLWGTDILNGGDGNDYIEGNGNSDTIKGGKGDDTIFADVELSRLEDMGVDFGDYQWGNDTVYGGSGEDYIFGGGGFWKGA